MSNIPYLKKENGRTELIIDGKPFYARSGELHNSSSSSLEYMDRVVWPALRPMHMNSVIAPIYWECIEPEEGAYDFTLLDGLVEQARREGMRLILLWFGLWKNSASTYVPGWVKKDSKRFWNVMSEDGRRGGIMMGKPLRIISPLCAEAVEADAKAYAAVMKRIREIDEQENTIITMQVENEIGILGLERDYSPVAQEAFEKEIPPELAEAVGQSGSWQQVYGKAASETFMAWYYGRALETIIAAGKKEYPIPMYVNAWLEQYPWNPGSYPSGGPQFKMVDTWRVAAPSVDFYAPDIYVEYFKGVCDEYASKGNPLFIPEVRQSADTVAFYFYAVGRHNALCFAPFGIEDMMGHSAGMDAELQAQLNISMEAMRTDASVGRRLSAAYEMVINMEELVQQAHKEGRIHGFVEEDEQGTTISMKYFDVKINFGGSGFGMMSIPKAPGTPKSGGMLIELSDWEFVVLGTGCTISVQEREGTGKKIDIERKEEGRYINGEWQRGRILNGDELMMRSSLGLQPEALRFKLYEVID